MHLSGAKGCFSWLDTDANWRGATGSFALLGSSAAVGRAAGERRLWLLGEPVRCLGSFAEGSELLGLQQRRAGC